MTKSLLAATAAAIIYGTVGAIASAEEMSEVTITAKGMMVVTPAGRTSTGIPIKDITLSYGVSTAGLDLTSHTGMEQMEKRINDAAQDACAEIGRKYPNATPDAGTCAKLAAKKALDEVHKAAHLAAK